MSKPTKKNEFTLSKYNFKLVVIFKNMAKNMLYKSKIIKKVPHLILFVLLVVYDLIILDKVSKNHCVLNIFKWVSPR